MRAVERCRKLATALLLWLKCLEFCKCLCVCIVLVLHFLLWSSFMVELLFSTAALKGCKRLPTSHNNTPQCSCLMTFACVLLQRIDWTGLGDSRNGKYWQCKRGMTPSILKLKIRVAYQFFWGIFKLHNYRLTINTWKDNSVRNLWF